jgi:GntR family transcriptional regulator/MocR family aminotransferase
VQGLDKYQRTLYIGTFSKTLYPGLRMGYMVLPCELVKPFAYARSMMDGHTPQTLQLTLARFMEDGHYNAHVRAMRKLYAGRRSIMHDAIGKYLSTVVTAELPPGGLQIPCLLKAGWSEEKTIRQAANAGVQLSGLSGLYAGEPKRQGWLLGYSSLTAYEIEAAMLRLANALKI